MTRQLLLVSGLTAAAQLAAFLKLWVMARLFGVGGQIDGYYLALVLPTLVSGVLLGFLQTGLFPVRARLNATASVHTADFERSVLWSSVAIGLLASAVMAVGSPWIVQQVGAGSAPAVREALADAFPWLASLTALNMLADSVGYLLAMRGRFWVAAAAPVANGLLGAGLLVCWPEGGLQNLILGTLGGLVLQIVIAAYGLRRGGLTVIGALLPWVQARPLFIEMVRLGGWILPGVVFSNLIVSLPPLWIAAFGEGAVSAFSYAYRLHSAAVQLLVMAGATVILAEFSEMVARGESASIRRMLRRATAVSAVVGLVACAVVGIADIAILETIFGGRFDRAAADRVGKHWFWLTIGLGFVVLGNVYAKLWQAQGRPRLMSLLAGVALFTLTASYWTLRPLLGEFSLAASLAASSMIAVIFGLQQLEMGWYEKKNL